MTCKSILAQLVWISINFLMLIIKLSNYIENNFNFSNYYNYSATTSSIFVFYVLYNVRASNMTERVAITGPIYFKALETVIPLSII